MNIRKLSLVAGVALIACTASGAARRHFSDIVFIGNSLTYHAPKQDIQWTGSWGMAASSQAADYAHLVGRALHVPISAVNFSGLETAPELNAARIPRVASGVSRSAAVVVELGDNTTAQTLPAFAAAYGELLDAIRPAKLVCVSTWWRNAAKDLAISRQCQAHGGVFVPIGDIEPLHKDDAGRYRDRAVDGHPHDWSMDQIASRIAAALRE